VRPGRASLVAGLVALAALGTGCEGTARTRAPARAAILVLVDSLRADHVGAYAGLALTPRIDELAAHGSVFRSAYATSSWTRPSVASLFTSRYPSALGVEAKLDALPPAAPTLAETCRAGGVVTLGVSTNGNAGSQWGFDRGFSSWLHPEEKHSYPDDFGMVPAEVVTREALGLVDAVPAGSRFLLFLHYTDPHDPYLPHPELTRSEPVAGRFDGSRRELSRLDALDPDQRTAADEERIRQLYAGEVRYVDTWIGQLLDGLSERGLLSEALVVVTADHGEGLFDHEARAHGRMPHEEQIRIPLIVRFPAAWNVPPGVVERTASLLDVAPTVLAGLGLPSDAGHKGRDLAPCALDAGCPDDPAYSEVAHQGVYYESLRRGRAKLIRNRIQDAELLALVHEGDTLWKIAFRHYGPGYPVQRIIDHDPERFAPGTRPEDVALLPGERVRLPAPDQPAADMLEFYDLASDPHERNDLAKVPEELLRDLDEIRERNRQGRSERHSLEPSEVDPDVLDELRQLGYVED